MIATATNLALTIRAFQDEGYSGFNGFPATHALVGPTWVKVASSLLDTVVPTSINQIAAKASFLAAMGGISPTVDGILMLENALLVYATQIGLGMAPAFVAVPPLKPDIKSISSTPTSDAKAYAETLANYLTTWAKTGTATPASGGSPILWS